MYLNTTLPLGRVRMRTIQMDIRYFHADASRVQEAGCNNSKSTETSHFTLPSPLLSFKFLCVFFKQEN